MSSKVEVSMLLKEWSDGDRAALDKLLPLVYDELHRLAARLELNSQIVINICHREHREH